MSDFRHRRNWEAVTVTDGTQGFSVCLDGRAAKTPGGRPLDLPTRKLASEVAREWDGVSDDVDFRTMPFTRRAFAALDWVSVRRAEAVTQICRYAAHDLLCHRAPAPLAERQDTVWRPTLEWAERKFNAQLVTGEGIMPIPQPSRSLENLRRPVDRLDPFALVSFTDMVTLTGSLLIGLAVTFGRLRPAQAWEHSRIDEEWQAEQWGRDAEADAAAAVKRREFIGACEFAAAARKIRDTS